MHYLQARVCMPPPPSLNANIKVQMKIDGLPIRLQARVCAEIMTTVTNAEIDAEDEKLDVENRHSMTNL
jgi:hypothetical protein